jgi:hypothetical protein
MDIKDTTLYVAEGKCSIRTVPTHPITKKDKPRLTDGRKHPTVVIYPDGSKKLMEGKHL